MPLTSDLTLNAAKFDPSNISDQTKNFNDGLIKIMKGGPLWWEVGAEKYRQMRWNGETPLPKPVVLDTATNSTLPSRDASRSIPTRIFKPAEGAASKGLFLHIHGGGWVLQSEAYQDLMLQRYATASSLTVISIGYRLAPEYPYPAGNEDCFDAAAYLVDYAQRDYGVEMMFVGGDSAGAHLSVLTAFKLREVRPEWEARGLVLNFGAFDLSGFLPQLHQFDEKLVLDLRIMEKYIEAYTPDTTEAQRRDPWISPFFAKMREMKLPAALFTCGTSDPLLDDSVMMAAKWAMSGAESILKIYPGAPHGFSFFPVGGTECTEECLVDIASFMDERIG